MKRFSIIHAPLLSFFSEEFYRDVALYWEGTNLAYLLLLLAVCWIPVMVRAHIGFADFLRNDVPPIVNQVPKITITNGRVSVDEPQPYYIRAQNGAVLAVIDTTGQITSLEDPNTQCLLTRTKLIGRKSRYETRVFDLSQVKDFVVDNDRITGWLRTAGKLLIPVLYPFALFGSYVYRIVQVLMYAAIGMVFAKWFNVTLSYTALLRLAVVAVTPCIIINTVLTVAAVDFRYAPLFYLIVALGYLFYAVKAASQTPPGPDHPQAEY